MGRKRRKSTFGLTRILGVLLLAALIGGAALWWHVINWRPETATYPVQGAIIGESDGRVDFRSLAAIGANFVYLQASEGESGRDAMFPRNYDHAKQVGVRFGAIHRFDPCIPAERQAANFVTVVPRDADLLPPAVELDETADTCSGAVGEAAVESELMTFLNQIESHAGQPAILKIGPEFEAAYGLGTRMERSLWLTGDRVEPDYAGRPFALWTANTHLRNEASDGALRWVVARK